jgi:hypothetical protein
MMSDYENILRWPTTGLPPPHTTLKCPSGIHNPWHCIFYDLAGTRILDPLQEILELATL